jgi:4-amino-4-deoxychorismate lyase
MKIAVNGQLVDGEKAVISVYDHGFLYGIGCFETFRTYGGAPFLLDDHVRRLMAGCREMGIALQPHDPGVKQLRLLIGRLLEENGLKDAYFRLSVSAGAAELGLPAQDYGTPTVVLYVKPLAPLDKDLYERGRPLQILNVRRNSPEGKVRRKSFHFLNNLLAKRELASCSWASGGEGLMLTERGQLAEGIVSNLFFVRGGKLHTPAVETGILPGITRQAVLALAGRMGIESREGFYDLEELTRADEIFVTNSIQELVPIRRVFDPVGRILWESGGGIGPINGMLLAGYRELAYKGVDSIGDIIGGIV